VLRRHSDLQLLSLTQIDLSRHQRARRLARALSHRGSSSSCLQHLSLSDCRLGLIPIGGGRADDGAQHEQEEHKHDLVEPGANTSSALSSSSMMKFSLATSSQTLSEFLTLLSRACPALLRIKFNRQSLTDNHRQILLEFFDGCRARGNALRELQLFGYGI
jgi:hypothetical protein